MEMTAFVLNPGNARDRMATAWRFACQFLELGQSARIEITEAKPTRTLEQNSRLWALLTDVSRQVQWPVDGKLQRLSPDEWKDIFSAAHTKGQRVAQGIDGGFVMLGARTSKMKVGDMCELQCLIEAFGVEHNVVFNEQQVAA
jgi:NinB protein